MLILRRCGVPDVRLAPQDSQALHLELFSNSSELRLIAVKKGDGFSVSLFLP
jgi:hypothetical protein